MGDSNAYHGGEDNYFANKAHHEPLTTAALDDKAREDEQRDSGGQPPKNMKSEIRYAGFWMRFWAYLLDLIVVWSINGLLVKPVFRAFGWDLWETGILAPISIAYAVIFYAYFVFMTKKFGQTLGKMVMGLKVIALEGKELTWGTVLFREWIGRYISKTIVILYIIVGFTPKKQGIHDLFADTTVIHEG